MTLMHEHVVTDLRAPGQRVEGDFDAAEAFGVALPFLRRLRGTGCFTLVEPTPINIGWQPETLRQLSGASDVNIICATGFYGAANQKFIPDFAFHEDEEQLAARIIREAEEGIGGSKVKPGLIKTGVNKESPLPAIERKLVTAALLAHKQTGLVVASHTGGGSQALEQISIATKMQVAPSRFIWVHAQNEKDRQFHIQLPREGVWVEFDG